MIPNTIGTALAFLVFIVPGTVFQVLRARQLRTANPPALDESPFTEATRVAVTSAFFTGVGLAVVAGLRQIQDDWVADPAAWLRGGRDYTADHLALVTVTLVELVAASLAAVGIAYLLLPRLVRDTPPSSSAWYSAFRLYRPPASSAWIHARLCDGTEVWGYVESYSTEQSLDSREIIVTGPGLQYQRGGGEQTPLDRWAYILLRGDRISWMKVQYIENASGKVEQPAIRQGST